MSHVYGQEAPSFSIIDVLRGMARRKLMMLASILLGLLIGVAVVTVFKPTYQSEARVLIDNLETPYDRANVTQADTRDTPIDERTITSQVAVLSSEDLAVRVVTALDLPSKAEFDPMKKGLSMFKQIMIAGGFKDDPRLMTVEQRALERLYDQLTVYPIPESNVIGIKFEAGDGQTAADVANTLAHLCAVNP
jgi:polysaccharide biosynthesis transport protein